MLNNIRYKIMPFSLQSCASWVFLHLSTCSPPERRARWGPCFANAFLVNVSQYGQRTQTQNITSSLQYKVLMSHKHQQKALTKRKRISQMKDTPTEEEREPKATPLRSGETGISVAGWRTEISSTCSRTKASR